MVGCLALFFLKTTVRVRPYRVVKSFLMHRLEEVRFKFDFEGANFVMSSLPD
jgi:hypothetical protein